MTDGFTQHRAECRSCHAPIVWATSYGGARIPINAEPDQLSGRIVLRTDARGLVHAAVLQINEAETARTHRDPLYTSHFATCPDADEHRSRKR